MRSFLSQTACIIVMCAGSAGALAQPTQSASLTYSGLSTLNLGQSTTILVSLDTASNSGDIWLSSFGAALTSTGGLTITDWALAPVWTGFPTDPFTPALAGFSPTPQSGNIQLWSVTVRADALGAGTIGFNQPIGDSRFVWNGSYVPAGGSRTDCFIAPSGEFTINVVPSVGTAAAFAMGCCGIATRRRRQ